MPVSTRRLGRGAVAGVLDAGLSSLATFITGLLAVRYLSPDVLGVYAVGYSAFLLGSAVPAMLVYTPAEVRSVNRLSGRHRLGVLRLSLPLGLRVALLSAVVVAAATLLVPTDVATSARVSIALSLLALVVLSSGQDHLRRILHQARLSFAAAATSAAHLAAVLVGLGLAFALDVVERPWLPFSVLAAANLVSLSGALLWVRRARPGDQAERLGRISLRSSLREGGALLVGTLATFGAGFAIVSIVAAQAGAVAAGQVEGARLLSQPATVVIVGLLAVLTPEIMTAASQGRGRAALRLVLSFLLAVTVLVVVYEAVAWPGWPGNPLPALVPPAYQVDNLLAVMIVAQVLQYSALAWASVPLALGRRGRLVAVDVAIAVTGVVVVLLLSEHGPWAAVLAILIASTVGIIGHACVAVLLLRSGQRPPEADQHEVASAAP